MTPIVSAKTTKTDKNLQRENGENRSRSAEPLGVFIYPQKKAVTKGGLMAEQELTGYRKRIFETQCKFCPDYQDRIWIARAINNLFKKHDNFMQEDTSGDGEWEFNSCYASCTWNLLHESNRQNEKTKKRYHRNNPQAKYFPEEKKYKARVK